MVHCSAEDSLENICRNAYSLSLAFLILRARHELLNYSSPTPYVWDIDFTVALSPIAAMKHAAR